MDKESKYNTIFFDAGGVLFDTRTSRNERIKDILTARGFKSLTKDNRTLIIGLYANIVA